MADLNTLLNIISQRRQMDEARREQDKQNQFNPMAAFVPAIISAIAAPFTGGASLQGVASAFGTGALKGGALEAARATTAGQPGAQQVALATTQEALGKIFPSEDVLAKRKFKEIMASGTPEQKAESLITQYPEIVLKAVLDNPNQPLVNIGGGQVDIQPPKNELLDSVREILMKSPGMIKVKAPDGKSYLLLETEWAEAEKLGYIKIK